MVTIFAKRHSHPCCKWMQLNRNLCLRSKATWCLFQPPGLIRSHKKFLRLKVCERILNLPSPGGWIGNEKVELSHSVTAEYRGNNPISFFPSEVAGVSVWIPPSLFHWLYCTVSPRQNICWQRQGRRRRFSIFLRNISQRSSGEFTATEKRQLVSFHNPNFGEAPNESRLRANNVCIFCTLEGHLFVRFGKVGPKRMIQKGPKISLFWFPQFCAVKEVCLCFLDSCVVSSWRSK